jgi:hypothetical protein
MSVGFGAAPFSKGLRLGTANDLSVIRRRSFLLSSQPSSSRIFCPRSRFRHTAQSLKRAEFFGASLDLSVDVLEWWQI